MEAGFGDFVFDGIHGFEDDVGEELLAHVVPYVFDRVELRRVWRQGSDRHGVRDVEGSWTVTGCAADFLILPVMTAVAMKVFLDELARRHDGQYILMIYDGAPCHSPGALNIPDTMTVRTLPPYSPQLNPVENIWDDMREKFFANIVFESMDAVENKISEACIHYEENTETVQSITAFPWIADNL